jgi:hypothetical protein
MYFYFINEIKIHFNYLRQKKLNYGSFSLYIFTDWNINDSFLFSIFP